MRRLLTRGLAAVLTLGSVTALGAEETRKGQGGFGFQTVTVAGFNVRLSPTVLSDPEVRDRIMWRLKEQLSEATRVLPAAHRELLRSVPIWVDPAPLAEVSSFLPAAQYFPMHVANRLNVRSRHQAGAIVLPYAETFIRSHGQGNVMLHELAHAYDDRMLRFKDPSVGAAFGAARQRGLYAQVASSTGLSYEAYANTGQPEYFAELTVAYFAGRSDTPRNRQELRTFDPQGYRAVERAWGPGR